MKMLLESVKNAQRTSELLCALGETDLTRFGVNDRSKIYSNGVVCVSSLTVLKQISKKPYYFQARTRNWNSTHQKFDQFCKKFRRRFLHSSLRE